MCDYKEYPNHTQVSCRRECFTEIMKFVKIRKKIITLPRQFFVYNSLLVSLKNLTLRKDFLHQCEQWRQSTKACDGWLTDVYDGRLWREWFNKAGR